MALHPNPESARVSDFTDFSAIEKANLEIIPRNDKQLYYLELEEAAITADEMHSLSEALNIDIFAAAKENDNEAIARYMQSLLKLSGSISIEDQLERARRLSLFMRKYKAFEVTAIILLRNWSKQSDILQYRYSVCRFFNDFDNLKLNLAHLTVEIIRA